MSSAQWQSKVVCKRAVSEERGLPRELPDRVSQRSVAAAVVEAEPSEGADLNSAPLQCVC